MKEALTQPLVSVIVPVYNAEQYLGVCLESLCSQTIGELEIICIDDGSTDGSAGILRSYAERDSRITVITQPNRGQGAARNVGLARARGVWVTGLDADDYLEPDAYARALELVTEQADIICFSSEIEGAVASREEEYDYLVQKQDGMLGAPAEAVEQVNVYFWNKLWRRSFIEEHELCFPEGLWYEDSAFAYCALPLARQVVCSTRKLHHYRVHAASVMSQTFSRDARTMEHLDVLAYVLQFYQRTGVFRTAPGLVPLVFRKLFGATMAHIPASLKSDALKKADAIACAYDLRRKYPGEGSINAARWVPWWQRPFFRVTYSKCEYRLFWIPLLSVKLQPSCFIFRVLGIPVYRITRN
ncbi:MAG: glycosyltransferase [Akkermansia sp.]|nr:glycosyltransferase [Akkermansia sp.]